MTNGSKVFSPLIVDQQQRTAAEAAVRAANSRVAYEQQLAQEHLRFALLQQQLNSAANQRAVAKSTEMFTSQNTSSSGCVDRRRANYYSYY